MNWEAATTADLPALIWQSLEAAVPQPGHPLRTVALGTADDLLPGLRTVVLRAASGARRQLVFHTDVRGGKIRQLRRNPHTHWLFYHPAEKIQIHALGQAVIHHGNNIAREAWQKVPAENRMNYETEFAPGTRLPKMDTARPAGETGAGFANFAVVATGVDQLEWLFLRPDGHRRAAFTWDGERFAGHWLAP